MEITLKVTGPATSALEILRPLGKPELLFLCGFIKRTNISCEGDQVADLTIRSFWTFQMTVLPPGFHDTAITAKKISCVSLHGPMV